MTSGLKQDETQQLYMLEDNKRIDVAGGDKGHIDFELRHKWHLDSHKGAKAIPEPCQSGCSVCRCQIAGDEEV